MNALNAYNKLNANVAGLKKASEKLSSGYRINRAGDDAAGLAISEKMRSQIRGLNQAVRNSQDGINMIQTFEGAAQETHSILQRMKELASESANGTYDNATDRAAIQLEFDHLNDELNQIADTDFNGTIVLNGGEMADGLKAEGGNFDYSNLEKQLAEAKKSRPLDLVAEGDYVNKAPELQDAAYVAGDPTATGKLWDQAVNTDKMDQYKDANEIYIKYTVSEVDEDTGAVNAYKGEYVDANGKVLGTYSGGLTKTNNGGFKDTVTGVNVVMDTIGAKEGDYVTVKYTKPESKPQAPTNFGVIDDYKDGKDGIVIGGATDKQVIAALEQNFRESLSVSVETTFTDNLWKENPALQDFIKQLDGATVTLSFKDSDNTDDTLADVDITAAFKAADGTTITMAAAEGDAGSGTLAAVVEDGVITIMFEDQELLKINASAVKSAGSDTDVTVDLTLSIDGQRYTGDEKPNASLYATKKVDKTVSDANAYKNSTARMTYAENIILQTGARTKDAVNFTFTYNADGSADMGELKANLNLSSRADGLNTANLSLATQEDANYAIDQIDKAINKTSMVRASFGAIQNRLEHKITNLTTTSENLQEAESSIRDTDMASEMMNYTKYNILQQAAQSMLAQANQQPQSILQLLG